jgi:hypothetical protein
MGTQGGTTGALRLDEKGLIQLDADNSLGNGGRIFQCPVAAVKFE